VIILDTHAWFWWLTMPDQLSPRARKVIAAAGAIGVSPLCCYELCQSVLRGRAALDRDPATWIREALAADGTRVLTLHPAAAVRAAALGPEFPRDPIDRLLYATAVELDAPLVTRDRRLRAADPVRTLW
jgi:PIN domain nuclease of toxin-antitoxin system